MRIRLTHFVLLTVITAAFVSCQWTARQHPIRSHQVVGRHTDRRTATGRETLDDRIALGRRLFLDSSLSRDSTISCATCHMPSHAFAEPRAVSHGIGLRARKRNSPSLINITVARANFDWDGRASTLEDQIRNVFSVSGDMGIDMAEAVARLRADRSYDVAFHRAYGRGADQSALIASLVTFQESLLIGESRFDRYYTGSDTFALSESEKRGWALFRSPGSGCAGCHSPVVDPRDPRIVLFSDGRFHNLGVGYDNSRMSDVGRYGMTREPADWGAFRTPSLRNVGLTADVTPES